MIEIDELVFSNYNLLEFVLNGFGIDSILVILDYNVGTFFLFWDQHECNYGMGFNYWFSLPFVRSGKIQGVRTAFC